MKRLARAIAGGAALVLLGLLLAGGCGLRTPAGIRVDQRSVDTSVDEPDISKLPPGPLAGASAADIVAEFLIAAPADAEHTYAKPFLAPGVVWSDRSAATVYDPATQSALTETIKGSTAVVRFTAMSLGQLSSSGAFLPVQRPFSQTYELRRVDKQWRLSRIPPGVLLAPRDLARVYRPVRTYNFNPSESLLVAEPGFVTTDPAGIAGAALQALLTQWGMVTVPNLSASRTLASGLSALGSVVVQNGTATVDLGREALQVPQARRSLLVSQIAASLASVPGVFTVRVEVEERQYAGDQVPAGIPADLQPGADGPVLALAADGSLEDLTSGAARPVKWVAADGSAQGLLSDPVASPSGAVLAALRLGPAGLQLVIADLHLGAQPSATLMRAIALPAESGGREMRPEWLDANRILLAVGGVAPRLELVDVSKGTLTFVQTPGLAALGPLWSFSVSRDGTRAIAISGVRGVRRAYLGRILTPTGTPVRAEGTVATGWTRIPTDMTDVADVAWSGDLEITVLGRQVAAPAASAALHAEVVELDGVSDPTPLPDLPTEFEALVAQPQDPNITTSPGRPVMLAVGVKRWVLDAGSWVAASPARDPSYP